MQEIDSCQCSLTLRALIHDLMPSGQRGRAYILKEENTFIPRVDWLKL